jgi:hypothetical protein
MLWRLIPPEAMKVYAIWMYLFQYLSELLKPHWGHSPRLLARTYVVVILNSIMVNGTAWLVVAFKRGIPFSVVDPRNIDHPLHKRFR